MIEAAMLFALGALVSALVALLSIAAVVRRTRRVTERRLKASLATRRAEYDTERDELRARHAVELRRLEREALVHAITGEHHRTIWERQASRLDG